MMIDKGVHMKKNVFLLLLAALLLVASVASAAVSLPGGLTDIDDSAFEGDARLTGRVVLPASVKSVGRRAFAGTRLHALVIPAGCITVDGSVLADANAAYLYLNSASTNINGNVTGAAYVFAPAGSDAAYLPNFYETENLSSVSGFYYHVGLGAATPLCAVDSSSVSGEVTIPKLVNGQPVRTLDALVLLGCGGITNLRVPAYLEIPSDLDATAYLTMSTTAPATSATSANVGQTLTWTTEVTGAYGETTYIWTFDTDGVVQSIVTAEPEVDYTLKSAGNLVVSVIVSDEVEDSASATAEAISVNVAQPVYRALLVGNTYPGTTLELQGPNNDVAGMRTMLSKMKSTPYRISTKSNLTADGMVSSINSTFSGATANDVSLFYFAGHGTNAAGTGYHGALMGTGSTYLTVARLKSTLDNIPGKKIVIIDSCHSGQMISRSGDGESTGVSTSELNAFNSKVISAFSVQTRSENDLANSGYYVITAAHSSEKSITMGYDSNGDDVIDKHYGVFTYGLCLGSGWNLAKNTNNSMAADANGDGAITLHEAYAHARYKAQQSNPDQTAQVYPSGSGMIVWAK